MLRGIWKDAQNVLLIKNMQINTIMKDYYVLDWRKEKLSNNTKCWQDMGMGERSPLVRAWKGTSDSKCALCLKTQREDAGRIFLPSAVGTVSPDS